MKIGIDCSSVLYKRTGVGNYVHNLLLNLAKIDRTNNYILFFHSLRHLDRHRMAQYDFAYKRTIGLKAPKSLLDFFWYELRYPSIEFFTGDVDIFHSDFYPPLIRKGKSIITVYDMSPIAYPGFQTKFAQEFYNKLLKSRNRVSKIITISNFSKEEILKYVDIPEEKIEVVYPGTTLREKNLDLSEKDILKKYQLNREYILFVGTVEPRKNLENLAQAFKLLTDGGKGKNEYELVIVGRLGWMYDHFLKSLWNLKIQDRVRLIGYVSDEELFVIYKHASLFVYPSIYEGFGLPVLEAMSCGIPVVTSNVSALPEIVGDAALTVNPYRPEEIYQGIVNVLNSEQLRNQLIRKGKEQIKKFSWTESAKKIMEVYEEVYNS